MVGPQDIRLCDTYTHDPRTGELHLDGVDDAQTPDAHQAQYTTTRELHTAANDDTHADNTRDDHSPAP